MKKFGLIIYLLTSLFFILSCSSSIHENDLWGVWNIGSEKGAKIDTKTTYGDFKRTSNSLIIDHNDSAQATIVYDGGLYRIDKFEVSEKSIILRLEYDGYRMGADGSFYDCSIKGTVVMHFINREKVWFEIDSNDSDNDFSRADFNGREHIYWRAKESGTPMGPNP